MGERIRRFDWSATPLGPPQTWPHSLRTAVRIMLTSRQPIWIGWGPELSYLYNDPYKSIIGGKHPGALGQPFAQVWHEIYDVVGPMAHHVMTSNEGTYVETQLLVMERHGYQEETYYTFSYSPIPDDAGEPGGLICANTDDTRRVIGERQVALLRDLAFRTANARSWTEACTLGCKAFATNARDLPATWIYAMQASPKLPTLVATSGPQSAQLGAPVATEALFGNGFHVVDLERAGGAAAGSAVLAPRRAALLPIEPSGAGNHGFVLVVALNPLREIDESYRGFLELVAGQISAAIANAQAYEEESRRAKALAELDRAKMTFFNNVSHEFRTPLTLMLGPVEDSLNDEQHVLDPVQRERMKLVRRGGLRLHKLVNSLLEFSRLEAGRTQANQAPTDLAALTTDLASSFRSTIERAGLQLLVDCPKLDEPAYVDPEMWEKIVLNLLSNAFKFTFIGSITVRLTQTDNHFVLTVQDTGIGIDPVEAGTVFDRFRRVEGARSRSHEGTGIGLALVRELVQLQGGDVQVVSSLGQGSSFTVRILRTHQLLPHAHRYEEPLRATATPHVESFVGEARRWLPDAATAGAVVRDSVNGTVHSGARIVWADDNADLRNYVTRLLAQRYVVEAVADGEAALAAVRRERPALVLSDVMMPRLDGVALLRTLRADPATRDIPVILLSARVGEDASVEGLDAGADDYLYKPFSASELLARVGARVELSRLRHTIDMERTALARLFAQTPVPTGVLRGPDLVFEMANPAYVEVMGGRELVGKPLLVALPEIAHQGYDELLRGVMRTGEPYIGREQPAMLRRNGQDEQGYFDFIFAPLRGNTDQIDGVIIVGIEVTAQVLARRKVESLVAEVQQELGERRRAESALLQSENRLSRALEVGELGAWELDVVGGAAWRSLLHDRIFGYADKLREWTYDHFIAHVVPEDRAQVKQCFEDALSGNGEWNVECRIRCADGEQRWIAVQGKLDFDGDMKLTRMKGLVRDVTSRRAEQAALREADRRKDEFIATLSHELRNPLAPLRNALHLLRMRENDGQRPIYDMMERQVNHLVRLVDDLLELSRISRGTFELHRNHVTVESVVRHAVDTANPLIAAEGHTLQVMLPSDPVWLEGDPVRISQILANLLNNAARYTPPRGEIFVEAIVEEDRVRIDVRDNGVGISEDALTDLFEMFHRGKQTAHHHKGGLGIGLALARRLAEMHGGSLQAHSEGLGKGSTFSLRLPLAAQPSSVAAPSEAPPSAATAQHRVLVVDDNRDAAQSLAEVFGALGAQVQLAYSGADALQALLHFDPSIIVLDIGMPEMDGHELARRIRAQFRDCRATFVALTGWGQELDRERTRAAGFDKHLVKPASIDELRELVREGALT